MSTRPGFSSPSDSSSSSYASPSTTPPVVVARRNITTEDLTEEEEDEDMLLQDALEDMAAEVEARDALFSLEQQDAGIEDSEGDGSEYIPTDEDDEGQEEDLSFYDDIEVVIDEDDDEEGQGDDDDEEGETIIDIRDLLRAHLAASADEEGEDTSPTSAAISRALNSIGLSGLQRLLAAAASSHNSGGAGRGAAHRDDDDEEEEEDEDERDWYRISRSIAMSDFWDPIDGPIKAGQELAFSGEFGSVPNRPPGSPPSAFQESSNLSDLVLQRKYARRKVAKSTLASFVPNTDGTIVASYPARVYCGQYSQDSSFFYTCTQDFKVHVYDTTVSGSRKVQAYDDGPSRVRNTWFYSSMGTTQYTSLKMIKSIQGRQGNWTITDANLSPDNQWMIYSSITPFVHLVPTKQHFDQQYNNSTNPSDNQVMLDFSNSGDDDVGVRWRSAIWSIRFSGDSREIVAGAHFGDIYVYDIEARRRVLRVEGHSDDVNGVAFADEASSNVLISGSDDSYVKVWDRRSLSGGKPAGVLVGHTEGITYVSPKGDGRYCISNGKDQSCKLWDLRMMHSSASFDSMSKKDYGLRNWDYRNMSYRSPRYQCHPQDTSVMTYRGHSVLKTLIRCHFSPLETTGQKYIYSGSADGKIHIWNLDGTLVKILDRSKVRPLHLDKDPNYQFEGIPNSGMTDGEDEDEEMDLLNRTIQDTKGLASDPSSPALPWVKRRYAQKYLFGTLDNQDQNSPSTPPTRSTRTRGVGRPGTGHRGTGGGYACTVRDVSWHPNEPSLISTAWDGIEGESGSIAKHELADHSKRLMNLEDFVAQQSLEALG